MRPVDAAGRPIHEERFVRREGAMFLQPGDPLVGHVLGEVVFLVVRRFDGGGVLHEARLPLRGFAGEEAVEVFKAVARGPVGERPHGGGLVGGGVVPFAEGGGFVAVVLQDLGNRRGGLGNDAGVTVPIHRALGDRAAADTLMVAPGKQSRAGGRTDGGGVKAVVADAFVAEAGQRRRMGKAAEGVRHSEAGVVNENDEDVGRILRQAIWLDAAFVDRLLQGLARLAGRRRRWERQHRTVIRRRAKAGRQTMANEMDRIIFMVAKRKLSTTGW